MTSTAGHSMKITNEAREMWRASFTANTDFGPELASDFAVLEGIEQELREAFDARTRLAQDIKTGVGTAIAFDALQDLLEQVRQELIELSKSRTE